MILKLDNASFKKASSSSGMLLVEHLQKRDKTPEMYVMTNLVFFDRSINFMSRYYIVSTGTIEKWIFFFVMYDELKMVDKNVNIKFSAYDSRKIGKPNNFKIF
jgi:hypothetical protein